VYADEFLGTGRGGGRAVVVCFGLGGGEGEPAHFCCCWRRRSRCALGGDGEVLVVPSGDRLTVNRWVCSLMVVVMGDMLSKELFRNGAFRRFESGQ
jgi:hypothetical protein